MAKFETHLTGSFDAFLNALHQEVLQGSLSASFEDGSTFVAGDVRVAVRVYERYSMIGSNRVSLSITLIGQADRLSLSAIASGGSQAVFWKVNTFGETAFLDSLERFVRSYQGRA